MYNSSLTSHPAFADLWQVMTTSSTTASFTAAPVETLHLNAVRTNTPTFGKSQLKEEYNEVGEALSELTKVDKGDGQYLIAAHLHEHVPAQLSHNDTQSIYEGGSL